METGAGTAGDAGAELDADARDAEAQVETAEDRPFAACRDFRADEVRIVDATRRRLYETMCGATLWFDGLFGEGDLASARRTNGRLEVSGLGSEFEGIKAKVRFRVRVRLPALQDRLSAFVGRDNEEEVIRDRVEGFGLRSQFPSVDDDEEWLAGLGYALPEAYHFQSDFKVGARSLRRPKVFAQSRLSYTPYSDQIHLVHLRLTPFINNIDGLGATASADASRTLSERFLLRWGSVGTVLEEADGVDWRHALILYQNLFEFRAIAYEAFVRGNTSAAEPLGEYGARAIYRQPLLRKRLYLDVILGYSWPRIDPTRSREGSLNAGLGVELPFGSDD